MATSEAPTDAEDDDLCAVCEVCEVCDNCVGFATCGGNWSSVCGAVWLVAAYVKSTFSSTVADGKLDTVADDGDTAKTREENRTVTQV